MSSTTVRRSAAIAAVVVLAFGCASRGSCTRTTRRPSPTTPGATTCSGARWRTTTLFWPPGCPFVLAAVYKLVFVTQLRERLESAARYADTISPSELREIYLPGRRAEKAR